MNQLPRITFNQKIMGGKPCIRGLRVTVGALVVLVAAGHSFADILKAYSYLEEEDLREALAYAAKNNVSKNPADYLTSQNHNTSNC
jgi:uncharacterized protein (DUF433 family)